ncbi:MAG: four helix bundle protein [Patescibacteria group bacterium]|nr:four helix bundle protein [Patescibacteria group bacterium]
MNQPSTTHFAVDTWKLAHRLTLDIYKVASQLPQDERHALGLDLRKRSVWVASNIVAGHARKDEAEFFGRITEAVTALEETKYSLLVARDLGFVAEVTYDRLMADAEHVSERLEELRGRLRVGEGGETAAPAIEKAPEELPAAPDASADGGMFMPADHQPTFQNTKSVGSAVKDLWGWLKGTPGRFSKDAELEGHVWTEDAAGTPNYLERPGAGRPDEGSPVERAAEELTRQ